MYRDSAASVKLSNIQLRLVELYPTLQCSPDFFHPTLGGIQFTFPGIQPALASRQ